MSTNNSQSNPMSVKAYTYVRLSSQAQAWGDGERRQIQAAQDFALRYGLTIDETMQDVGVSAYRSANSRGGVLGHFLKLAQSGVIERGAMLIIESVDRLTRDEPANSLQLLLDLLKANIRIGITAQNRIVDGQSFMDWHSLLSEMARANSESAHKSMRSKANWETKRTKAAKGVPVSSLCPLWLEVKDGAFREIPERVDIVRRIFEMYLQGIGRTAIARCLKNEGIPPWNKRQLLWQASYVYLVLTNRAVIGEYQPQVKTEKGFVPLDPIEKHYPRIISDEDFARVQDQCLLRRLRHYGRKGIRFSNLFQGIAKCSECGGSMRFHNRTRNKNDKIRPWAIYLVCASALIRKDCSHRDWHNYLRLENFIFSGTLSEVDIIAAVGLQRESEQEGLARVDDLEAQVAALDTTIIRILDMLDDKDFGGMNEVKQKLRAKQKERDTLRERLADERAKVVEARTSRENIEMFRQDGAAPGDIDMSDDAVYARRARIALQLKSVIDNIECAPDHKTTILLKSGVRYELENRTWTRVARGYNVMLGKEVTARTFAGLAVTQLS